MSGFTHNNALVKLNSAKKNSDGTVTYEATFEPVSVTYNGTYTCTATVTVKVVAPSTMPEPGSGNVFNFDNNGGYDLNIAGGNW